MLPIYLKDRDFIPPADTIYYLLSRDGLFLVKRTPFFEAVVPATGIPWLESQEPEVRLGAPPLPAALLLQAVAFFRAVYSRYEAEAVALLTWREATRTYELVVPHQTVGGGHCDYEVREFPAGLMRLGTIHSHAGIDAFHSWRDSAGRTLRRRLPPHHRQPGHRPLPVVLRGRPGLPRPHPPGTPLLPLPHPLGPGPAGVGMDRRSGPESHSPAPSHRVWAVKEVSR